MCYLDFPRWMMTLSKRQNGYLNQCVILFRLKYETHSLQMHPKSPCRSVISPKPNILEQRYTLRLVVVLCWYFTSLSLAFPPISQSLTSHIYSVAVLHLLCHRIRTCCLTSTPPCLSAAVLTTDLVCHCHYPASPPRLPCYPPTSLLRSSLHYISLFHVLCRRCLYTLSNRIFSLLYIVLYYTACSALLYTTFITLRSDLITTL